MQPEDLAAGVGVAVLIVVGVQRMYWRLRTRTTKG